MAHSCYHVSSNWLTSYTSRSGVFCEKVERKRWKGEGIAQYLVMNPLGVTAFSGTLERKLPEDTSVPWQKMHLMIPWFLTSNIHGELLQRFAHVYLCPWFLYYILFWNFSKIEFCGVFIWTIFCSETVCWRYSITCISLNFLNTWWNYERHLSALVAQNVLRRLDPTL